MTNEEIQRVMEFIIKRQESFSERVEQFSAKLQRMEELHEERLSQHEERIRQLERAAVNLFNTVEGLGQSQRVLTVKMVELAEAQTRTEQRLNVLIDIIEQGRGGMPEV